MIPARQIDEWFTYHAPNADQIGQYQRLRDAAKAFATVTNTEVPDGPDKSVALRKLREAVMTANAAIALGGL